MKKLKDFSEILFGDSEIAIGDSQELIPALVDLINRLSMGCHQMVLVYDRLKKETIYYSDIWYYYFDELPREPHAFFNRLKAEAIDKKEWNRFLKLESLISDFYNHLPQDERLDYVSMFASTSECGKKSINLLHREVPLCLTYTGEIWLTMVLSFPATNRCFEDDLVMVNPRADERFSYDCKLEKWKKIAPVRLSERERSVLIMAVQGKSLKSIAETLCISLDSVKSCRRKLFERLKVDNILEATTYVMNCGYVMLRE